MKDWRKTDSQVSRIRSDLLSRRRTCCASVPGSEQPKELLFSLAIPDGRCYQGILRLRTQFVRLASRVSEKRAAILRSPCAALDGLPYSKFPPDRIDV